MSRLSAIRTDAHSSVTVAASGSSSTHGRAAVNGRSSSAQPSGVSQRSQPAPADVSAITRSSSDRPTNAPPSSSAIRRVGASWLASAPTPTYTGIVETTASAM